MKVVRGKDLSFVAASHEDQLNPGTLKRVLFTKEDFANGRVQMVNWAKMPAGRSFQRHLHEDMDEVFVIVSGRVEARVGDEIVCLEAGDAVLIPCKTPHQMRNITEGDTEYVVFGVSRELGGKTVILDQS